MKLSIITINYNNKAGLQKTIDSVVAQTWRDFEWIVIDGGSTDGSKELIEQYQQHFAYWCSEPDKGVYNAMNKGIEKAKGEYLNFMNSGDSLQEETVLETVFKEDLYGDMLYGDWNMVVDNDKSVLMKSPTRISLYFFYSSNICHQAMFIKLSVLKKTGYDETFHVYADWARWIRMCLEGATFQYIPVVVCEFDARDGLSRRDLQRLNQEKERLLETVPETIRVDLDEKALLKEELSQYKQNFMIQDTYFLMKERLLYFRLIHFSLKCIKVLKRIIDILNRQKQ